MKISKKKFWYIIFTIFIVIVCFNIFLYLKPVKSVMYKGRAFIFREDIKDIDEIQVLNNETYIYNIIWDSDVKNVKILFNPNVTNMGYYSLEVFELTNKLSAIYMEDGLNKNFVGEPAESYDNIFPSEDELIFVLIHPDLTDESYIKAEDSIIYIAGKNLRDFDLAIIKTILIAMNYKN